MKALFDSVEAAEYLGVNVTTVYDYVKHGLLAVARLPKRSDDRKRTDAKDTPRRTYQFRKEDLDRFIADHVIAAQEPATNFATAAVGKAGRRVIERDWWKRSNA